MIVIRDLIVLGLVAVAATPTSGDLILRMNRVNWSRR